MNPTRVADLTVDEFIEIIKRAIREVNAESTTQSTSTPVSDANLPLSTVAPDVFDT